MKQLLIIILAAVTLAACYPDNTTSHAPTIGQWQSVIDQGVLE